MGRKKQAPAAVALTPPRAARLYKLLVYLTPNTRTRPAILHKLKVDTRGFYRDVEALRRLGIVVALDDKGRYELAGSLDNALTRFPFPDPGLNVREALQLVNGTSAAHRKLRQKIDAFLKGTMKP